VLKISILPLNFPIMGVSAPNVAFFDENLQFFDSPKLWGGGNCAPPPTTTPLSDTRNNRSQTTNMQFKTSNYIKTCQLINNASRRRRPCKSRQLTMLRKDRRRSTFIHAQQRVSSKPTQRTSDKKRSSNEVQSQPT